MDKNIARRKFLEKAVLASGATALVMHGLGGATSPAHAAEQATPSQSDTVPSSLPMGKIAHLQVSRLFCGGNLIGGWAHSRDLVYVSSLVKAYHSDEKVLQTLELAEAQGINTILTNPNAAPVINRYWKERGGRIQWFSDCAMADLKTGIKTSIDNGAHAVYVQGGIADREVANGRVEVLAEALQSIKQQKVPGGLGAHKLETVQACVKAGLDPDFWVKTLHPLTYWSAKGRPENDNIWCQNPEETIEYMKTIKKPWIAFKVMAAGAVPPKNGFQFAFENGADFVCAGMFDFQIVEDVIIAKRILASLKERQRPWQA